MKKLKSLIGLIGILLAGTVFFIYGSGANVAIESSGYSVEKRADVITIDTMKGFGSLERPEVGFLHDLHSEALKKEKKDCTTCHLYENNSLSPKFKRIKDTSKQEVMDIYHTECMACHKEIAAYGKRRGPVEECGECHSEELRTVSSRQPMGFNKSLHFRHSEANKNVKTGENDCGVCHHEYNKETKKLFYAKGKEGSCRYCHKKVEEENRIPMREASHLSCIDCHNKLLAKRIEAGPIKCGGCHDLKNQQKIKTLKDVPRIERNQPDVVLVQAYFRKTDKKNSPTTMSPVPFNHKAHEEYNQTCIVCHHESLDSCLKQCHTVTGSKEGNGVKLEQAMHQPGSNTNCLGCHQDSQKKRECAGCHASIKKNPMSNESLCITCHMNPSTVNSLTDKKPEMIAELMFESRKAESGTYSDEEIPEKLTISEISDQYEPVEFPHQQIIHRLMDDIKENKLAGYFHVNQGTICQGCHHNSPATNKPPRCVNCHGKPFDEKSPLRPGLKAAYHQQCMSCHKEMGIEKPRSAGCVDCHKEVGQPRL